jgi:hypothetical protein
MSKRDQVFFICHFGAGKRQFAVFAVLTQIVSQIDACSFLKLHTMCGDNNREFVMSTTAMGYELLVRFLPEYDEFGGDELLHEPAYD